MLQVANLMGGQGDGTNEMQHLASAIKEGKSRMDNN